MSLDVKITNIPESDRVQVEINSSKANKPKYYNLPENRANSFIADYKKNDRKTSIITNTAFGTSILAGVLLVNIATRKLKSNVLKWILNTTGGITGGIISTIAANNYMDSQKSKLLKQHDAREINYDA